MDERWMRALQAKGINADGRAKNSGNDRRSAETHDGTGLSGNARRQSQPTSISRAKPFKATGHKGGISRQGN